jgi:cell division protein FtsB
MMMFRSLLLSAVLPAGMLVSAAYQGLMAFNGPEGFVRAEQLTQTAAQRQAEVNALRRHQARLEERADRLVLASLDEDLLEERVRANLGHMRPGEYRIPVLELDAVAALETEAGEELTDLIAVALLESRGA